MDWILVLSTLASALAAAFAWAAKLWWGKETIKAKDATIDAFKAQIVSLEALKKSTIEAKDAQIDALKMQLANLQEMMPTKLREYLISLKTIYEEIGAELKKELETTKSKIEERDKQVQERDRQVEALKQTIASLDTGTEIVKSMVSNFDILSMELRSLDKQLLDTPWSGSKDVIRFRDLRLNREPNRIKGKDNDADSE